MIQTKNSRRWTARFSRILFSPEQHFRTHIRAAAILEFDLTPRITRGGVFFLFNCFMFIILFVTRWFFTVDLSSRDLDHTINGFSPVSIRIVTQGKKKVQEFT